jgi:mannose-6-phosphate isomerase-like protein (cupin superfamily)
MRGLLAAAIVVGMTGVAAAQSAERATAITAKEIDAVRTAREGGGDRQIKVVDIGKLNLGVGVLHRDAVKDSGGPVRGLSHTLVTEVYYITSGAGTLFTGGAVSNTAPMAADAEVVQVAVGPSVNGVSTNGQVFQVSVGDVVVIPAGLFHGWKEVPDHVTYLSIRPDPNRVLPVGYVHPAIR